MALFDLVQSRGDEAEEREAPRRTFKDCAAEDVNAAFFNALEHAQERTVDGRPMRVILEEDDVRHYTAHWEWGSKNSMDDGLYLGNSILYVRQEDYGARPKAGRMLTLDGRQRYRILQCREEDGVYRIRMERAIQ